MKETYTIHDLCLITGLTDRTLRNHIADGYLKGQKTNGAWQFTKQQVDDFFNAPQVWPGIQAKKNAIVYDFLRNKSKKARKMCVILDLPGEDGAEIGAFFCRLISNYPGFEEETNFSIESVGGYPRIILQGATADIMALLEAFHQK